jgi:hypothetical protein
MTLLISNKASGRAVRADSRFSRSTSDLQDRRTDNRTSQVDGGTSVERNNDQHQSSLINTFHLQIRAVCTRHERDVI